jgi:putative oxidoreductase
LRNLALLLGRFMAAAVFVFDAYLIVKEPDSAAAFITQIGLPGHVAGVPLVMVLALCQFVGAIMLVCFAAFCVATAVLVHHNFGSTSETIQAGKDIAIAGGFLFLFGSGPGRWSIDGRRGGL